ncbi:MAG TPA: carboxypeptidase regulatory-like domain-containing protein [Candidatus Sulfotelmatobacter sp.]
MARIVFIFGILLGLLAASFCACAQDVQPSQATSQATSSISGTVVDVITGQPLKSANVWARNFQPGQGGRHFSSASTDAEGHFLLDGLAPGRYAISASREDYVGQRRGGNGSGSKLLTVVADQHIDNLILPLTPGAVVAGHVRDAAGKALTGVSVEVLRYFYDGGQKQLHGVRSPSLTNPEGEYRIPGLAPGRYYLRASTVSGGEHSKSSSSKSSSKEAYAAAYYPGSSDLIRAVELVVLPGADLSGIDLTLPSVRTVDVSGKVLTAGNSIPATQAEVTLVDADGSPSSTRQCVTDVKGNFELHDVLPGNYVLLAQVDPQTKKSKMFFGSKPVDVDKVNLSKIEIAIGPGTDVSGRIHLDDKGDDKAKIDLSHISVELQPEGNSSVTALMPGVDNASVNSDGGFLFTDVPEGTYLLNFSSLPAGYYMKSTGAADALETGVTVARSQPLPALDLTLSSKVARLEGDVSSSDQPAAGASVVLVPEGTRTAHTRYYRQSMTDQSGRFSMKSIVPGDYKVFAFEDLERGASLNPDFLQPFEDRSRSVHLQEGGDLNLRLEAIPASETSP